VLLIPDLIIFNREAQELDPEKFPSNIRWQYEHTTGTGGLRKHIKNLHLELYRDLCNEHNIQPSEAIVENTSKVGPMLPTSREPFNQENFLCHIVNFIVADDQVGFN